MKVNRKKEMAEQITDKEIVDIIRNLPFEQMAESYVQFQKYQQAPENWDEKTRRQFLKVYKGPGTGQSYIFNKTIDNIHSNITDVINKFKESKPEGKDSYEAFSNNFKELIKKYQTSHTPRQVIRAMAITLFPTTYCQIADPIKLKEVYKHLNINSSDNEADGAEQEAWDSMNRNVQNDLCDKIVIPNGENQTTGSNPPIVEALNQLKDHLKKHNLDLTQCDNDKDDELRKFIISFIPWEIYEQKIKVEN